MLVSHAHSFRQQARLAVTLAWVAGYTNILTVLTCGTVTSHMSGTASNLGREIFSGAWGAACFATFLLGFFCMGAGISGFTTELGRRRGWESIFILPIAIEALLLAVFAVLLRSLGEPANQAAPLEFVMIGLASAAMGLQNATITQISQGQVRTTHITGVLTDFGQESVQFFWWLFDQRKRTLKKMIGVESKPTSRLALLAAILFTFTFGAGLGTLAFRWGPRYAMFPPVIFLLWIIYQDTITPIAEIKELTAQTIGTDLPPALTVFHLRKEKARVGSIFRIPNLLAWSDRLPVETRVVILDVAEITEFNANALLELRVLLERFTETDRTLIISGLNPGNFERMMEGAIDQELLEYVCSDLSLAIARGLNHLRG